MFMLAESVFVLAMQGQFAAKTKEEISMEEFHHQQEDKLINQRDALLAAVSLGLLM